MGKGPRCGGVGFQEEEFNVVIGPEPWPWPFRLRTYSTVCCCLGQCVGQCIKVLAEDLCQCLCQLLCCGICCSPMILLILLPVLNFNGSRAPRTELEALTIHDFNLTRDNTSLVTPWLVSGNFTVVFQARNPSSVVGFRHRYLSTIVTIFHTDTQLGQSEVSRFSLGHKSARNVNADVIFKQLRMNESVGLSLQSEVQKQLRVGLRITVDADVKVKRLGWQDPKWFNLTCSVEASMISSTNGTGHLLTKSCH